MGQREKIKQKKLDKDYRREKITLNGRFGQSRRIEKSKTNPDLYNLHIYGKYRNERQYFNSMAELSGIIKGIFIGRTLTDDFITPKNFLDY